ncbi:beta-glucosidase [Promethearchaeum syntrophicum]|uniref:Beta-glucosidase n=1 Tax=Promethearchaeum syntrophicum TaxID=2594042 RepID=A0A5B9DAM6_9ARCH|nr:glycoside hydrolase family 3 C-terminal domain-containing protein [Candidatus Prometheoarchaeum syntrophicum]QEE15820.1 beta-hexosaminidase [Candidatus Prometheoarchaeum syntrophicum]
MHGKFLRKIITEVITKRDKNFAEKSHPKNEKILLPKVNQNLDINGMISHLFGEMTLNEKIDLISGENEFGISAIPRLGLQRLWCSDATAGVHNFGRCTAFSSPIAMAASWNRDVMQKVGDIIGKECRAKGVSILLAPGINIYRVPTNGRNFEYLGEDPFLASELVVPYIQGVQNHGIITTVKHFVCNNSDYNRHRSNSIVDERTLHEIYFPAFKAAIQRGGSKGIMCSYNLLNGVHCSENKYLLTDVLRRKWGFTGFVISDWYSLYSTEGPLMAGLDLEMPKTKYYSHKKIEDLLQKGKISQGMINDRVINLLRTFLNAGVYGKPVSGKYLEYGRKHDIIAKEVAQECPVLLKNDNAILPLDNNKKQKIVILGKNSNPTPTSGGGACDVIAYGTHSILKAVQSTIGNMTELIYLPIKKDKIKPTDAKVIESADYVILAVGLSKLQDGESWDRDWKMPYKQNQLIKKVVNLNPSTIVVLNAGGGIKTESWIHKVPAVLLSFYLGQNSGDVIAEILFGKINPSGKLPFTMAKNWNDFSSIKNYVKHPSRLSFKHIIPRTAKRYRWNSFPINYLEGIMVGYRHFDTNKIEPQFPFGFGLSYTSFTYNNLRLSSNKLSKDESLEVLVDITNSGKRGGMEVVQLYLKDLECSLIRPEKELKGFEKISLEPGETKTVQFSINPSHLAFYDAEIHDWKVEEGDFAVLIGRSSKDIELSGEFRYI